jgi:type III pantothenate kinase
LHASRALPNDQLPESLASSLNGSRPALWLISSVHDERAEQIEDWLVTRRPRDRWRRLTAEDVPLSIAVDKPRLVGVDRLCAAVGARALARSRAAIIVDAGSAVTVDAVSAAGAFLGGTISLGIRGQLSQLAQSGSALPTVEWKQSTDSISALGKSTEQAMLAGTVLATAGGINQRVRQLAAQLEESPLVFLTGGDAPHLQPWLDFQYERRDDLVLSGILIAGQGWLAATLGDDG